MQLSEREQKLCREIESRGSALLEDLRLHVAIPTGGGNQAGLDETRERFAARSTALGSDFELYDGTNRPDWLPGKAGDGKPLPTAVCRRWKGEAPKTLIAGHLDTVHDPAGDFQELSISPDGKTATGPGCVDMKGGLVIAMAALEALEEVGIEASWTFSMNSDEETGSYYSENTLRSEAAKHDWGLALEPAMPGGELAIERMGSGQFMVVVNGRSAHVGRDFESGVSAVTALGEVLQRIGAMADPSKGRLVNAAILQGGTATNAVPDRARVWGNVRYPTMEVADELRVMFEALATDKDAMPQVEVHTSFARPAKPLIPATERLALFAREAAGALGQELPFAKTGGVCDGNILQDAGLPSIDTLGVRGGGLHTLDEWIDLSSLVERCQLLALVIARIAEGRLPRAAGAGARSGVAG